jgi:arylsulfatase
VTAEITVPDRGATGVIVAQGGEFGGWSLYLRDGVPTYCYNLFGIRQFHVSGSGPVAAGTHQVRMEFTYDGGGLGKGGSVALLVDGARVGEGRVDATVPMLFSADETTDLGIDNSSPVSSDYTPESSVFTGTVHWVQLDIGDDDHSHMISPEDRIKIALTRQ